MKPFDISRESYERGGWNDGRLGRAHDLIDAVLVEICMTSGRHPILSQIEMLDEELNEENA